MYDIAGAVSREVKACRVTRLVPLAHSAQPDEIVLLEF